MWQRVCRGVPITRWAALPHLQILPRLFTDRVQVGVAQKDRGINVAFDKGLKRAHFGRKALAKVFSNLAAGGRVGEETGNGNDEQMGAQA